jgi:hypothetical protein
MSKKQNILVNHTPTTKIGATHCVKNTPPRTNYLIIKELYIATTILRMVNKPYGATRRVRTPHINPLGALRNATFS